MSCGRGNIHECFIWRKIDACHNVRRRAASGDEHDAASRTSMMRIRVPHVNHRGCHSKFTSLSRNAPRARRHRAMCISHTHILCVCACTRVCRERPCVCACARTSKFSSRVSHGCVCLRAQSKIDYKFEINLRPYALAWPPSSLMMTRRGHPECACACVCLWCVVWFHSNYIRLSNTFWALLAEWFEATLSYEFAFKIFKCSIKLFCYKHFNYHNKDYSRTNPKFPPDHDDVMHFIIESCGDVNVCGWIVISSLRPYPTCSIREGSNMTHTHIRSFTHQLIMLLGPLGVCVCVSVFMRANGTMCAMIQTDTHTRSP